MLAGITNFYPSYLTSVKAKAKKVVTTSVTVKKKWDDTILVDHTHDEVSVQLYENGVESGNPVVLNEANNWEHRWDNLPQTSNWTVDEIQGKQGYEKSISQQQNDVVITNKQIVGTLDIVKEDADTKQVLQGAMFEVFDEQGKSVGVVTTDDQGKAQIQLAYGKYQVKEKQAPSGYQLSQVVHQVEITKQDQTVVLHIANEKEDIKNDVVGDATDNDITDKEEIDEEVKDEQGDTVLEDDIVNEDKEDFNIDSSIKEELKDEDLKQENVVENNEDSMITKEENVSSTKKKEVTQSKTESVETSDQTIMNIWWLLLTCSMLVIVCAFKYQLNHNRR